MIKQKLQSIWAWLKQKFRNGWKWILALLIPVALAAPLVIPNHSFENLPNVAKEHGQGIYRITFDEYSDVEIKDQDTPEVKLRKWGDETYIKISYPDFSPVSPKQDEGKLKWVNGDTEVHLYSLEPTEQMEGGGFEFEVILKKKPATNKIILDIELGNVKAYYQPPLDEEMEGQECWTESCTPTDCCDSHRPENIVGSYVFYHATKGSMHPVGEAEKYKTSQIGFLYRPKIFDAVGNWAWSEQEIKNGQQIVTISQDFLDNAVYPIRHAGGDTFGFTDVGGSFFGSVTDYIYGSWFTLSENGTGESISLWLNTHTNDDGPRKYGIYRRSDDVFMAETDAYSGETPENWVTHDLNSSPFLTAQDYYLVHWGEEIRITYNISANKSAYLATGYPASWPTPISWDTTTDNRIISIYATYTPATAGAPTENWLAGYSYRKRIVIAGGLTDLTDFPLYVFLDGDTDIGAVAQADGDDIRFTSTDGETILDYEEEYFNIDGGAATAHYWVEVPTVADGDGENLTDIWLYYGDADAVDGSDAEGTWNANYMMVQHLSDETTSSTLDSTSNDNDGTKLAANEPIETATAQIYKAQDFDGGDDYLTIPYDSSLNPASLGISAWIKRDGDSRNESIVAMRHASADGEMPYEFYIRSTDDKLYFVYRTSGVESATSTSTITDNDWHHVAVTFADSNKNINFFIDGLPDAGNPQTTTNSLPVFDTPLRIGRLGVHDGYYWDGIIDDVRIYDYARTPAEIKADYYSGLDGLVTWGSEETAPSAARRIIPAH